MNNPWKSLLPCFIISSGRTGTKFLANFFKNLSPDIDARHEPPPNILKLKWQFTSGKISLEKAITKFKKIRGSLYSNIKKDIYIEATPQLRFLIPVIRNVFDNYKIVFIIRDGRDWLRSAMNRGIYSSIINKIPLPIINALRMIIPHEIWLPKTKGFNVRTLIRDIWRFNIEDFKMEEFPQL